MSCVMSLVYRLSNGTHALVHDAPTRDLAQFFVHFVSSTSTGKWKFQNLISYKKSKSGEDTHWFELSL